MTRRRPPTTTRDAAAPPAPKTTAHAAAPLFPSPAEMGDPRGPYLISLLLLLASRVTLWAMVPLAAEDAYITFRYARNLASGLGLVYNPGEAVMGFSSPLWTVWNAVGWLVTRDPMIWSRATALLADLVTLLVMAALLRRAIGNAAAWCFAFYFAAWPYFAAVSMSGMETSVMNMLIVLSAALVGAGSRWSGAALAALALSRPEGAIAALLISTGASWRDRAIAAGLFGAALVALFAYYGSVVPQSVLAKSRSYGVPGPGAGRHWWAWLAPVLFGEGGMTGDLNHLVVLNLVFGPALVMGAIELWRRRAWIVARAIVPGLVIWAGYALLGVSYFWWYLAPPLFGIAGLAAVGLPQIVRGRALPIACAVMVLGAWTIVPRLYVTRGNHEAYNFGRAADGLARLGRPGEKVLLEPIGIVGWRAAQLRVLDEVGLVTPAVAERRVRGPGWYADVVGAQRPEWLAMRAGVLRSGAAYAGVGAPFRSAAERESLLARYAEVDRGVEVFGDEALVVFRRAR